MKCDTCAGGRRGGPTLHCTPGRRSADVDEKGVTSSSIEHPVQRAAHACWAAVEHVGIDHRGREVLVAEEILNRPDVLAVLQQMRREGVREGGSTCR